MKKYVWWMFVLSLAVCVSAYAQEETEETGAPAAPPAETAVSAPAPAAEPAPPAPAAEETTETAASENLEFISGEVSAVDQASKSLTVKLYGETEDSAAEKTISLTVDEATDITDGGKDRDLASLAAGTEVDVEYDPATNKATYIFVY